MYLKFNISNRSVNVNTSKMSDAASETSIYEIRLNTELIYRIKTFVKDKMEVVSTIYKGKVFDYSANCIISYLRLVKVINIVDN